MDMCTRSAPSLDPPCHSPMPTGLLPLLQLGCWQILDDNNLYVQELPTRFSTARPSTVFCGLPFVASLLWPVFCDQLSAFNVFLPGVWPLSLSSSGAKKKSTQKVLAPKFVAMVDPCDVSSESSRGCWNFEFISNKETGRPLVLWQSFDAM